MSINIKSLRDKSFFQSAVENNVPVNKLSGMAVTSEMNKEQWPYVIEIVDRLIKAKIYTDNLFWIEDVMEKTDVGQIIDHYYRSLKEPIIFLDIDGVLNTEKSFKDFEFDEKERMGLYADHNSMGIVEFKKLQSRYFCKRSVKNLMKIIAHTNAKVVISSSWRKSIIDPLVWREIFLQEFGYNLPVIGITGINNDEPNPTRRGSEIEGYLREFSCVKNYIILDDEDDMTPDQQDRLVRTSFELGLTDEMMKKAISLLGSVI